jgi:RNA polymerase sigma-70 factor, ECF subfamily
MPAQFSTGPSRTAPSPADPAPAGAPAGARTGAHTAVPTSQPTSQWTGAIAAGDAAAFAAFYDAWFDPTFALARTIARRDESFHLDVVQDVMLKVVRSLPVLATEAAVSAWMTRTVCRTVVDRLRSEQRRHRREQRAAAARSVADADAWSGLQAGEWAAWLRARLSELPGIERELVEARFFGGGSVAAAAHALGLSANAAHGRLRRCLDRLRRAAMDWIGT